MADFWSSTHTNWTYGRLIQNMRHIMPTHCKPKWILTATRKCVVEQLNNHLKLTKQIFSCVNNTRSTWIVNNLRIRAAARTNKQNKQTENENTMVWLRNKLLFEQTEKRDEEKNNKIPPSYLMSIIPDFSYCSLFPCAFLRQSFCVQRKHHMFGKLLFRTKMKCKKSPAIVLMMVCGSHLADVFKRKLLFRVQTKYHIFVVEWLQAIMPSDCLPLVGCRQNQNKKE